MKRYPFLQVDAFTNQPLGGNPCAILFDADDLNEAQMLAVAKEMNLSETSFVSQSEAADFRARYFTPAEEIPLAGHPTIATTFALFDSGRIKLDKSPQSITLELQAGVISVDVFSEGGVITNMVMNQKKPEYFNTYTPEEVMPVFGLTPEDLYPGAVIQTMSTGTPQLMVPLKDIDVLRRANVDIPGYMDLREKGDFFSPHLFVLQGLSEEGDTFARHFGVPPDTPEDPFTGSATGGMAAYLWHHGLIEKPRFVAEQGHWMARPGVAQVEVVGPPEDIQTVRVGGQAVLVLQGEFLL